MLDAAPIGTTTADGGDVYLPAELVSDDGEETSLADHLLQRWYHDPALFAWEVFGVRLWGKQRLICRLIAKAHQTPQRIACKSGHKTGKSCSLAVIAIWWAVTRKAGRVIITAPTGRQIRDTLWREVKAFYNRAREQLFKNFAIEEGLGGKLNQIPDAGLRFPDGSEIIGFSTNQPERMAGTSGENLLYLIDEATGVGQDIFNAIEGNRAGDASVIMFSNPTQTSGYFFDAFHGKNASAWHRITISSEETPNVRAKKKVVPGLATHTYIAEKRKEWGPDFTNDLRYQIRILGVFPRASSNQIVSLSLLDRGKGAWYAFAAKFLGREQWAHEPKRWRDIVRNAAELYRVREAWEKTAEGQLSFGIDPAWDGDDKTVIRPRRGLRMLPSVVLTHGEGEDVATELDTLIRQYRRWSDERPRVLVDAIGVGVATVEALRKRSNIRLYEVNSSRAAMEPDDYRNLRSEILFAAAHFLKSGGGFEPDPELERDLSAATYTIDSIGRVEVEPKKNIKKRLGRSPDEGDAFSMAAYEGHIATSRVLPMKKATPHLPNTPRPRGFG